MISCLSRRLSLTRWPAVCYVEPEREEQDGSTGAVSVWRLHSDGGDGAWGRHGLSLHLVPATFWRTGYDNAYFKKDDVRLEGNYKVFERPAPEGRKLYNYFCPTCGTTLAWRADLRPDVLAVAAGCFTDKNFPPPSVSMWEETMCGWVKLPEGTQHFPRARLS